MSTEQESDSSPYEYYHLILRSRGGKALFTSDSQRAAFLELIPRAQQRTGIGILAYCLLTNEIHFLVRVISGTSAKSRFVQRLKSQYARRVHKANTETTARGGQHLFVSHCWSKRVLLPTVPERIQRLHRLPIEHALANNQDEYRWTSHRAYKRVENVSWLSVDWALELDKPPEFPWPLPLSSADTKEFVTQLIEAVADQVGLPSVELYSGKRSRQATLIRAVVAYHAIRWGVTHEHVAQYLTDESSPRLSSSTLTAAIDRYELLEPHLFKMSTQELLAQVPRWRMRPAPPPPPSEFQCSHTD